MNAIQQLILRDAGGTDDSATFRSLWGNSAWIVAGISDRWMGRKHRAV